MCANLPAVKLGTLILVCDMFSLYCIKQLVTNFMIPVCCVIAVPQQSLTYILCILRISTDMYQKMYEQSLSTLLQEPLKIKRHILTFIIIITTIIVVSEEEHHIHACFMSVHGEHC